MITGVHALVFSKDAEAVRAFFRPGRVAAMPPQMAAAAPEKTSGRYLVRARSVADYAGLRAKAVNSGGCCATCRRAGTPPPAAGR